MPTTQYYLALRTHDASAPSIVQGWRNNTASRVACSTTARSLSDLPMLLRVGDRPELDRVRLRLSFASLPSHPSMATFSLEYAREGDAWQQRALSSDLGDVPSTIELDGLKAGSTYWARLVRAVNGSMVHRGEATRHRTARRGATYTQVYRVSEYTRQVDFLDNHNSGSLMGEALFLSNDNDEDFYAVSSPVTRYCIEHDEPSTTPLGGWAEYTSCNGPEAAPRNHPADPLCICFVYADRLIALQNASVVEAHCDAPVWAGDGSHSDPPSNCSRGGEWSKWVVPPGADRFIGRAPVWRPYFYWQLPTSAVPSAAERAGWWYSTPKATSCADGAKLGEGDCTWKRLPEARVVYGGDLLALGWNRTAVDFFPLHRFGPDTRAQDATNDPLFERVWDTLPMTERCCGC